jgi:predicted HTH domain antitoxin
MKVFTITDLQRRTSQIVQTAEAGELSLIAEGERPIFLAMPFSQEVVELGLAQALAIKLYQENVLSMEKAAKLAGTTLEAFIERLSGLGTAAVDYPPVELHKELKDFG